MPSNFFWSFVFQILIVISSISCIMYSKPWMDTTKLSVIIKTPIVISIISVIASFFSLPILFAYYLEHKSNTLYLFCMFSVPFLIAELLYFYQVKFNIESFFSSHFKKWSEKYSSKDILIIQKRLNCCGFFTINEFPASTCSLVPKLPCIIALQNVFGDFFIRSGYISLMHSVFRAISFLVFFYNQTEATINEESHTFLPKDNGSNEQDL